MNILRFLIPKSQVAFIQNDCSVRQGLEKMRYHGYNALPVIDAEGRYVGMVKDGDFLWLIVDRGGSDLVALEDIPLAKIIRQDNPPVKNSAPMTELLERVKENNFVPVIDDRECFIGLIRRKDVIEYFSRRYLMVPKNG
ncbi:MAG: CBS domain-containing protein [Clostridia bacterium]|nr:CBS domain-containing protein [Clostridia bacterium]MDY6184054.1 CBS domain-containing protein [Eubacteriales bacterium]